MTTLEQLRALFKLTDPERPPPDPSLFVASKRPVAQQLAARILIDPAHPSKYLLYGARGGGKSSQLHQIARNLRDDLMLVDIDLDESRVSIAGISAFDLLYIIGVGALRELPVKKQAEGLYAALVKAYAEGEDPSTLGKLEQAISGVAGFGSAIVAGAAAASLITAPAALVVAGISAVGHALRLRTKPSGIVAAASPAGRELQDAVEAIFAALRAAYGRPVAVLIDGLEKVNGGASQWMRNTFENTRLLTDTSATMVVATPPCPFSDTNSAAQLGWAPHVVFGFAPDDFISLEAALALRLQHAGIDPDASGLATLCGRLAHESGGHPRHAMLLLHEAVVGALTNQRAAIAPEDVQAAIRTLREVLEMGLIETGYSALRHVLRTQMLPDDEVAPKLFSDGRILAYPPTETSHHTFHVHPLLQPWVEQYRDRRADTEA